MDATRFDALTRALGYAISRRASLPLLGGLLAFVPQSDDSAYAKKKKKKKTTLCLDGQTIQASKKKKKKLLKSGATPGECSPPPPPGCMPNCPGTCGTDDGCGGICACAANAICHQGACHACTVTCTGSSTDCGVALIAALVAGGTIYVCPGRYTGSFSLGATTTLIGAGKGNDSAVDTILDANGSGRVLSIAGATATLSGLHITGGNAPGAGGGILNEGRLTIDDCAIVGNSAVNTGGGIHHHNTASGPLAIGNSTVAENDARNGGGLYLTNAAQAVTISDCVISGNRSTADPGFGGGIHTGSTPVVITGSTITENSAVDKAGGIANLNATVTFDSASSVTDNTATDGGGIYNDGGTFNFNGATVSGNSVPQCVGVVCPGT